MNEFATEALKRKCPFVLNVLSANSGRTSIHFLWKDQDGSDWIQISRATKHQRFIIGATLALWWREHQRSLLRVAVADIQNQRDYQDCNKFELMARIYAGIHVRKPSKPVEVEV